MCIGPEVFDVVRIRRKSIEEEAKPTKGRVARIATTDAAAIIARTVQQGDGLEMWRRRRETSKPAAATRRVARLPDVVSPRRAVRKLLYGLGGRQVDTLEYESANFEVIRDPGQHAIGCPFGKLEMGSTNIGAAALAELRTVCRGWLESKAEKFGGE